LNELAPYTANGWVSEWFGDIKDLVRKMAFPIPTTGHIFKTRGSGKLFRTD
jgi:hypothetical protein